MLRIDAPIEQTDVKSYDGTSLRVYVCGRGKNRWLLPPGLGTPVMCWKYLFEYFHERMTIVTWDPRACYDSAKPDDLSNLGIDDHTEDALAVMRAVGWDRGKFVTGGWSMGVEVGLELYRRIPERILALTLINGAFEHVLTTAFDFPKAEAVLRALLRGATAASPIFAPLSGYLLGRPWAVPLLKKLKIVASNEEFFLEVLQDFKNLDFATYFKMIARLDTHSAADVLPTVRAPTLVTAGTGDMMTPLSVARFMHEQIAGSELFVVPGGTHYTTIEYPEIVNLKLEQFFRNRVFGRNF